MVARTLPNLGLKAFYDLGEDGWKDDMDLNLLKLSVLTQGRTLGIVDALPAGPEGAIYVLSTDDSVNVFTGGAWTKIAALEGMLLYDADQAAYITFVGGEWDVLQTGGGGGGIPEAPEDGKTYGRKNKTWAEIVSGGGGGARYAYSVPAIADFNIVLDQNPARQFANLQSGGIFLYSGQGYRTKTMAAKAPGRPTFRCRMKAAIVSSTVRYFFVGLGIANAASPNDVMAIRYGVDDYVFSLTFWQGVGNNAGEGNGGLPSIWNSNSMWFELEVTDTQIIGRVSFDGGAWFTVGTLPRSRLPANVVVGPYLFSTPGDGGAQGLLVSHFEVGPVDLAYPTLATV